MSYTNKTKVEQLMGIAIPAADNTAISDFIAAVTAWIDRYCGKSFEDASATKYYDGNGQQQLNIDSFIGSPTVTLLNIDGTTDRVLTEGQSDDYITYPYNDTEKYALVLTGCAWYSAWPKGRKRIKVVANFGAADTVPADIEMAATKLVANLYREREQKGSGAIQSVSLGDYSASFGTIDEAAQAMGVYNILDLHRDVEVWVH